jgi:hypothetical protein
VADTLGAIVVWIFVIAVLYAVFGAMWRMFHPRHRY